LNDRFPYALNIIADDAAGLAEKLRQWGEPVWLSDGYAFDLFFAEEPRSVLAQARSVATGIAADVNVVATERRRKKLLVADMDSTIIACECLDEIAEMAGFGAPVAAITERAMRGEIAFEPALRERVALLKDLPLALLERVYAERVRLNPGAGALVGTMRAHGAHTILVSGGFTFFTRRIAAEAGFHAERANRLLDDGEGRLTGFVAEPVLGREAKLDVLQSAVAALGIDFVDSLAVGDGANDLGMIERAGLGVAYHAKPIVAKTAQASIIYGDLKALLYLQGFGDDEIRNS
jgi:phosphoserine phosphatase